VVGSAQQYQGSLIFGRAAPGPSAGSAGRARASRFARKISRRGDFFALFSLNETLDLRAEAVELGIVVAPLIGERRRVELAELLADLRQFEQTGSAGMSSTDRELDGRDVVDEIETGRESPEMSR